MTRSEGHSWQSVLELVRSVDPDPAFQELVLSLQPHALEDHRLDVRSSAALSEPERDRLRGVLAEAASQVWGREVAVDVLPTLPATPLRSGVTA